MKTDIHAHIHSLGQIKLASEVIPPQKNHFIHTSTIIRLYGQQQINENAVIIIITTKSNIDK